MINIVEIHCCLFWQDDLFDMALAKSMKDFVSVLTPVSDSDRSYYCNFQKMKMS